MALPQGKHIDRRCVPVDVWCVKNLILSVFCVLRLSVQIDDVVDASPVHMFCGAWGVLAAGLLAEKDNYGESYYSDRQGECCGAFYG